VFHIEPTICLELATELGIKSSQLRYQCSPYDLVVFNAATTTLSDAG